jgi:hypothetical protein
VRSSPNNPGDQTNWQGDAVALSLSASDPDGDTLTYGATGLPPGVSINTTTGLISGSLGAPDSGSYSVTVSTSDGDAVVLQPTVETNGNPMLTFSATGLPNGLSINPNTGLVAGTLANLDSNSSPYSVTISATDGTSTSSQTFTWTVTHVLLTDPGDQINAPGDVVSLPIQASDPDNDTLTYSASGLPQGLSINTTTGLISGTIDAAAGSDRRTASQLRFRTAPIRPRIPSIGRSPIRRSL